MISLADFLPVLFLAPFAGVLADRRDRVWTIRLTQWIGCVQASLLAILVVSDAMTIEILFALPPGSRHCRQAPSVEDPNIPGLGRNLQQGLALDS